MESKKDKKNLFIKTMERCRSFGSVSHGKKHQSQSDSDSNPSSSLKRVWKRSKSSCVVPGCFTVCVGEEKKRFVVKTECLNHPHFQMLLEEAENEFGFASDGPIELPCKVEEFENVMMEMEEVDSQTNSPTCGSFSKSPYRYGHLSPSSL